MIRTQIYLTKREREELSLLANQEGKAQSTLIREAIDQFIESKRQHLQNKDEILKAAKGLWADNENLPDLKKLRSEFTRYKK